jgi:hypothetical protein
VPSISPAAVAAAPIAATSATAGGPYDPNGYRPSTTAASSGAPSLSLAGDNPSDADRYGAIAPGSAGAGEPDRYSMVPDAPLTASAPPNANMPGPDRYSMTSPSSTPPIAAAPASPVLGANPATAPVVAASQTAAAPPAAVIAPAAAGEPDRYAIAPLSTAPAAPATTPISTPAENPSPSATVRITAPAGQYRPGGTGTFTGLPTDVEIASRPASTVSATTMPTAPAGAVALPAAAPTTETGTRTY